DRRRRRRWALDGRGWALDGRRWALDGRRGWRRLGRRRAGGWRTGRWWRGLLRRLGLGRWAGVRPGAVGRWLLPHRRMGRWVRRPGRGYLPGALRRLRPRRGRDREDRKSTRLNSSHVSISYAVFCLKKKNTSRPPSL